MPKRKYKNNLNDLSTKDWLLFQKSWFIHNPPPRGKNVMLHPAKFPEGLAEEFITFFTKQGETVLDPMAGTGSTLVAAIECGRNAVGVELQDKYAAICEERLDQTMPPEGVMPRWDIINDDSRTLPKHNVGDVHYVLTSPPYWDMLRRKGYETQKERAKAGLDVHYSDDPNDVGNIDDYDEFVQQLCEIYRAVAEVLLPKRYMTVVVKNVKKGGTIYPLAWDLGREVGKFLTMKDEKIWCQDNQRLAPYGMGNAWVSNTMHHYCLQFRKDE